MQSTQYVRVSVSIAVPGQSEPIKLDQWVPLFSQPDQSVTAAGLLIHLPLPVPRKAWHSITVNYIVRTVPSCVASVLAAIAASEPVRFRAETKRKITLALPELMQYLRRDSDYSGSNKMLPYKVLPGVKVIGG